MIGTVLNGRYEILEKLGGGGMAVVYKARDVYLSRPVSLKVLRPQFSHDAEFLARFRREAQAVASLSHPNIVSLYDVGEDGDVRYLVMEYVEGVTLKDRIAEKGPLPPAEAVRIAVEILDALEHAHSRRVIHRDIKPHNILLDRFDKVKVTDFGIARALNGTTLVHTGNIVGSAYYFSPEQAQGRISDERSDLYSVGVVLYEMLTGRVPFQGESPVAVALKHVQEEPVPPSHINPQVPPGLDQVVARALAKDPSRRYQSAAEFRRDLLSVGLGGRPRRPEKMGVGRPALQVFFFWLGLLLVFLAALGFGIYLFHRWFEVPTVRVPDVRREDLVVAQERLQAAGLRGEVVGHRFDSEVPANYVLEQDPPPGEEVKRGRKVELLLSRGPELVLVPGVVGKTRDEALVILENAGLKGEETQAYDERVPAEVVISQRPAEGNRVGKGTTVSLVVSKGPPPPPFPMPDLRGQTQDEARRSLAAAGLRLGEVREELGSYPRGQVAGQDPPPGTRVREGEVVNLVVSAGCARESRRVYPVTEEATVRVLLVDRAGERVLHEAPHVPGDQVEVIACWSGEVARIQIFYDGLLAGEEVLTP